jgi:protein-disulfide isomerase
MGSAFLVTLIFVLASKDLFLDYAKIGGEQRLLAGTVTFILIMALLMEMPDIMAHMRLAQIRVTANINGPVTQPADAPPIITPDMESTGPADAKYTIVEFADYQCPHCKKSSVMINEELKKNPNRFRFAFRNYPLPSHKWSSQAACAAEAAGEQGKFWQMHDYIFEHQADMNMQGFSEDVFTKYAEALGIKSDKFEADAASDKIMTRVANDSTTAQRVKVAMTPSFFIVNRKGGLYQITGMEKMKAALDDPTSDAWK